MLARIQTLYLFLTLLIIGLTVFLFPLWVFEYSHTAEAVRQIELYGLTPPEVLNTNIIWFWGYNVLLITTLILSLGAIFMFKQRNLQLLFVKTGLLTSFLTIVLGVVTSFSFKEALQDLSPSSMPGIGFYLILLIPVLLFLAYKGIQKDEKIANAYKRL